jgi:dihydroxyacetone kinase DhaKLM complex PTS-EIIA-like component DhaM
MDLVDIKVRECGGSTSISITLTEDMTREEQIMDLIEKYIKEGATIAAAERKAKDALAFLDSF